MDLPAGKEQSGKGSLRGTGRSGMSQCKELPGSVGCGQNLFFNPFSLEILREVISRILESYYEAPRRILLFFYYPSDEYMSYLMTVEELLFLDEIHCMDLFPGNYYRERIVIFELQEDYCGTRADA